MTVDAHCIPPHLTGDVAAALWPLVERGLSVAPEVDRSELFQDLSDGFAQMWLMMDGDTALAIGITQIVVAEDGGRDVWVFALAGKTPRKWIGVFEEKVRAFARAEGARRIVFAGKTGWRGFVPDAHIIGSHGGQTLFERAP